VKCERCRGGQRIVHSRRSFAEEGAPTNGSGLTRRFPGRGSGLVEVSRLSRKTGPWTAPRNKAAIWRFARQSPITVLMTSCDHECSNSILEGGLETGPTRWTEINHDRGRFHERQGRGRKCLVGGGGVGAGHIRYNTTVDLLEAKRSDEYLTGEPRADSTGRGISRSIPPVS
jgi:hypothetical protein